MITKIEHINTLERPDLEPYRTLKRPMEHLQKGIFVAEGEKVISRLFESDLRVFSLLLTAKWFEQYRTIIEHHPDLIDVFIGEKHLLDTIVGHELHQAMMAVAKVPKGVSVEDLATKIRSNEKFTCVLIDGVVNAENMGVIIRNCASFGVDAIITLSSSCDPYLRRSVRNSMGNIFRIPIVTISDAITLSDSITFLKQNGLRFYAAHPHTGSKDIRTVQFNDKSCIVLGAEGHGISKDVLELCDEFVTIPMKAGVDSLNVASASAVLLWEVQNHK
ncbi:MAG: RNA methyltransferase [Ignavibacteriales bacterium]|nr:RNA methyltransferase [Ignavibacteriales bacterium]